jgi:NAD(P)H-dependent flavin oxidoreductase YrpB (nitropropane dioxygenase family)
LHEYGKLGGVIPIYRSGDIEDEDMEAAVTKIIKAYDDNIVAGNFGNAFHSYIDFIHVKSGTEIIRKGNIEEVGCDATEEAIADQFVLIALGLVESE